MKQKEGLFRFRDLVLEDGHVSKEEFEGYLKEAEDLGTRLIAFGKKVHNEGSRL